MSKNKEQIDELLVKVGDYLGVPPERLAINPKLKNGIINIVGPAPSKINDFTCPEPFPRPPFPLPSPEIPELPRVFDYCFTIVLDLPPPTYICLILQAEYNELKANISNLVQEELWGELAVVAARLEELRQEMKSTCQKRTKVVTYCIFPTD